MFVWVYCSEILCERQRKHVGICPLFSIGQGRMPSRMRGDACGFFFHFVLVRASSRCEYFALRTSNFRVASIFSERDHFYFKFSKTDHKWFQIFQNRSWSNISKWIRSKSMDKSIWVWRCWSDQWSDQVSVNWINCTCWSICFEKKVWEMKMSR